MLPLLLLPFFLTVFTGFNQVLGLDLKNLDPDAGLPVDELVKKYGYPLESHQVQTEDGYLLTMHRIPHGRNETNVKKNRPAALLMHGLLSNSVDFLNTKPENALGMLLADRGYDVWLGNQRGNTWSKKHITLDPIANSSVFFNFSFHEIGYYDLAAKIDYILNVTGEESLAYIGHSQGTTTFFVLMSERPEYNQKVRTMQALAPVAYMEHLPNPILSELAKQYLTLIDILVTALNIHEFLPHYDLVYEVGKELCVDTSEYQWVCSFILNILCGFDDLIDPNIIPVVLTNLPAGSSIRQVQHYFQEVASAKFRQYDHGLLGNLGRYGTADPPLYDIKKITTSITLHYSSNDWMAAVEDVEKFASELPNLKMKRLVPFEKFNHLEFLWAKNVVELVYDALMTDMDEVMMKKL